MAEIIDVPPFTADEERRLLAVAVNDLYKTMDIIVQRAGDFIPGEAVGEVRAAWEASQAAGMAALVRDLARMPPVPPPPNQPPIIQRDTQDTTLRENGLTGESGALKRSMLGRLKDNFLRFFHAQPSTSENLRSAAEGAAWYLELGESVVKSITGYHHVEEILGVTRTLINIRARRGV